jgi:hypothetical protein
MFFSISVAAQKNEALQSKTGVFTTSIIRPAPNRNILETPHFKEAVLLYDSTRFERLANKAGTLKKIISTVFFCQISQSPKPKTRQEYLALSRSQKVAGFIFLGAGLTTIALISKGNTSLDVLPFLAILGAGATSGSLPFFVASARNKRKARNASASLKFEEMRFARATSATAICYEVFPAASIKICF